MNAGVREIDDVQIAKGRDKCLAPECCTRRVHFGGRPRHWSALCMGVACPYIAPGVSFFLSFLPDTTGIEACPTVPTLKRQFKKKKKKKRKSAFADAQELATTTGTKTANPVQDGICRRSGN